MSEQQGQQEKWKDPVLMERIDKGLNPKRVPVHAECRDKLEGKWREYHPMLPAYKSARCWVCREKI